MLQNTNKIRFQVLLPNGCQGHLEVKLFFRLVDVEIYNAYTLYKHVNQSNIQLSAFCLMLIKEISTKFEQVTKAQGQPAKNYHKRLIGSHYISSILSKRKQRKCHICNNTSRRPKKRKDTGYECKECNVGL